MNKEIKHLSLIILDGLGERRKTEGNAYKLAKTPSLDFLKEQYPSILINASGREVGLPIGQMGNSEVGHLNIGSGRIIKQSLIEISEFLADQQFPENKNFQAMLEHLHQNNSILHLIGLVSDGGIHSNIEHLFLLIEILERFKCKYYLHFISDGRDSFPTSGKDYLKMVLERKIPVASISGRYYAMDRDRRWERIQLAYDVIANNKGLSFSDPMQFITDSYKNKVTDEFIIPGYNKELKVQINSGDAVLFFNFRADRMRELGHMIIGSDQKQTHYDYQSPPQLENIFLASFREIVDINTKVFFPTKEIVNTLGDILEAHGISQIRAAETEKYPHVTFFMDGGKLLERKGQLKLLVPSPKVATYDLQPEMSAILLTEALLTEIPKYQTSIINFANSDMVGHTGVLSAAIKAVETVDQMLAKLYKLIVQELHGVMIITADHGNAETMVDDEGRVCTTHTTNPVRVIITSKEVEFQDKFKKQILGKLSDLAPTFLALLGLQQPKEMNGEVLIKSTIK